MTGPRQDRRPDGDVGRILETWMAVVAPSRAPERLLEESFARTMVAGQLRVYPWHAARRGRRGRSGSRWITGYALAGVAAVLAVAFVVFRRRDV
jgi:hypothetical protein